jgi:hypothetical protein
MSSLATALAAIGVFQLENHTFMFNLLVSCDVGHFPATDI